MKKNSTNLEEKTYAEATKLDSLEQYNRRQNLEFEGIPVSENEDVADKVVKIGKLIGVNINKSDILTAHLLPPKRNSKIEDPSTIIARPKRSERNL